uniref:Protein kinase domain-containing protein n=1 Tax=Plectus sambesii TaxID=2011161 RepID=A0A914XDH3_9BILA
MQQALEGLVHLHTLKPKPIVHRDIKCLNLLISETGIVKLGDLGLVHTVALSERGSTDPVFAPKEVAGTAYWQAPEVLKSSTTKTYGRKADVWSMGCCLVEMMTGYPPYFDKTVTQVQWVIKMSDGTLTYDPKELLPQASPDAISLLQKVFRRSTKKSPDNMLVRPHSWEILTDIIEINELLPLKERLSRVEMKIDALRSLTKEKENDDK